VGACEFWRKHWFLFTFAHMRWFLVYYFRSVNSFVSLGMLRGIGGLIQMQAAWTRMKDYYEIEKLICPRLTVQWFERNFQCKQYDHFALWRSGYEIRLLWVSTTRQRSFSSFLHFWYDHIWTTSCWMDIVSLEIMDLPRCFWSGGRGMINLNVSNPYFLLSLTPFLKVLNRKKGMEEKR
jgi:hypothetical protein